jgi:cysteine synthase A
MNCMKPSAVKDPSVLTGNVYESYSEAVGNTPLILLKGASERTGCKIYGKAEFLNPGGSVKDRAARSLIDGLERDGLLIPGKPGQIVVEGTAGNTGIGLGLVCNTRGYKFICVIPNSQSQEKKDMLKMAGATLVQVPPKGWKFMNNYIRFSGRLAKEVGGVWANQFDNINNRRAHFESTGPEIYAQLDGKIDAFSCAVGTGGTLVGTAEYLKSVNPNIKCCLTDPQGAAIHRFYKDGELKSVGDSITEGIGQGRITGNLEGFTPDFNFEIEDKEGLEACFELLSKEGLCVGMSAGINAAGAERVAKELGPGHTIVTVLCDSATRYQGKMFNREFLKGKGLPEPEWFSDDVPADINEAAARAMCPDGTLAPVEEAPAPRGVEVQRVEAALPAVA